MTEGEVLVPREPTEEMVRIGTTAASYDEPLPVDDPGDPEYADDVRRIYRAMIAAAPPKEAEPWRPDRDQIERVLEALILEAGEIAAQHGTTTPQRVAAGLKLAALRDPAVNAILALPSPPDQKKSEQA